MERIFGVFRTLDTERPIEIVIAGESYKVSVETVKDLIFRLTYALSSIEGDKSQEKS